MADKFYPRHNFSVAVALGLIDGMSSFRIVGEKFGPPVGEEVDVAFTDTYVFPPSTGEAMQLVSDNAGDTGQAIIINGLDENMNIKEKTFVTNGVTPVPIGEWSAINKATNFGPAQETLGNLDIETLGGGNTYARVRVGGNISANSAYTIPMGHQAVAEDVFVSMIKPTGSDSGAEVKVYVILPGSSIRIEVAPIGLQRSGTSTQYLPIPLPALFQPGTRVISTITAGAASMDFVTRLSILLVKM